jgi:hypothetical protein
VRRLSRRIPLCWQVSPLHLRFSPRARARAPTIGIDEMGENARSPLALARGPQPCAAVPVDSSLLAGFPTTLAIFPSRSREGPNRALRAAAHKPDSRLANPRGMRGNSGSREPAQKGSPRPRPGGNPWEERPEENRVSPRARARAPTVLSARPLTNPIRVRPTPAECWGTADQENQPKRGAPSQGRGETREMKGAQRKGFPSRSREGPNRALRAAAHKPDSRSANPRGMRGNSGSREPAQKGSPRPRPGGNPWEERPEENRVSPRASAGGNPRARGEFAHPRASGFSRGGGNGLKGLTIVYAAR